MKNIIQVLNEICLPVLTHPGVKHKSEIEIYFCNKLAVLGELRLL